MHSNKCYKSGIRIHKSDNDYSVDPFSNNVAVGNSTAIKQPTNNLDCLDLNIDNYSVQDLFNLFNIDNVSENNMKHAKQIVHKTHPDKSKLDTKYFLFFSNAYKRLYNIYEFQNKSTNKNSDNRDFTAKEQKTLLNNLFSKNKSFENTDHFNKWFNEQFDKYKVEDPLTDGYGEWLKSNDGLYDTANVTKADMAKEFEKQKKQVQALSVYNGVNDSHANIFSGSLLGNNNKDNYTSAGDYTDLRQAYVESVIPVTEEDFHNMPKFNNLEEYKRNRNQTNTQPLDKDTAMKKLLQQSKQQDQESAALAFSYAKQTEIANKKNNSFWGELKQLTNF